MNELNVKPSFAGMHGPPDVLAMKRGHVPRHDKQSEMVDVGNKTSYNSLSLFELPADILVITLEYLEIEEISLLDIAVSEDSMRLTFHTLIGSNKLSYDCPYSEHATALFSWFARREVRMSTFSCTEASTDGSSESLLMLKSCNFDRLKEVWVERSHYAVDEVLRVMEKIAEASRLIEILDISTNPVSQYIVVNILPLNPKVYELSISGSPTDPLYELHDILPYCTQLQTMTLRGACFRVSNAALPPIPTLTDIIIDHFINDDGIFTDAHLCNIADIVPNLSSIYLDDCHELTGAGLEYLASRCPKLSSLTIKYKHTDAAFRPATVLENFLSESLVKLCLLYVDMELLAELLSRRGRWLQHLELRCDDDYDATPILGAIIQHCSKLKRLDLFSYEEEHSDFPVYSYDLNMTSELQELVIRDGFNIEQMAVICRYFPKLVILDMYCCEFHYVSSTEITEILECCPDLNELIIRINKGFAKSRAADLAAIKRLPTTAIKKLGLHLEKVDSKFLAALLRKCPLLQTYSFVYNRKRKTLIDEAVARVLVSMCPLLQEVLVIQASGMSTFSSDQIEIFFKMLPTPVRYEFRLFPEIPGSLAKVKELFSAYGNAPPAAGKTVFSYPDCTLDFSQDSYL